jgi:hypothetical protein
LAAESNAAIFFNNEASPGDESPWRMAAGKGSGKVFDHGGPTEQRMGSTDCFWTYFDQVQYRGGALWKRGAVRLRPLLLADVECDLRSTFCETIT